MLIAAEKKSFQTPNTSVCNLNETKRSTVCIPINFGGQRTFLNENVKNFLNVKTIRKGKFLFIRFMKRVRF